MSKDHLGNTRLVTDGSMQVIARHDFLPFGGEIPAGYAGRDSRWGVSDAVNQKFTGQESDQETGMDFFQARYFSAAQGRFNSVDPANAGADLLNPQSWNGYAYVNNNQINAVDPTGMYMAMDFAEGFGGGGGWGDDWGSYYVDGAPVTASVFGHLMDMGVAVACPNNVCSGFKPNSNGSADRFQFVVGADDSAGYSVMHIEKISSTIFGQTTSTTGTFQEFLAMSNITPTLGTGILSSQASDVSPAGSDGGGVPGTDNVISVYQRQLFSYVKLRALNMLCPVGGSGPTVLKSLSMGTLRGAAVGAVKGSVRGAAAGTVFDGIGVLPGAVLGGAAGAVNGLITATVRVKTCEALGVNGY